jgi:WD40 repeat protein
VSVTLPVAGCRCVRISPDGTSVLTFGDGRARLWDASSGQPGWARDRAALAEFAVEAVWGSGGDSITLLTGGRLGLLDAMTGDDLPLPGELAERIDVTALARSENGATLAVGTAEGVVLLWQQDTGRVARLRGGDDPVTTLAWRPTTDELCVARPASLQLWQPAAEVMTSSINVGDVHPLRLHWTPDGDVILVAGLLAVRALSMATRGDSVPPLVLGGRPTGLGISRAGTTVLVGLPDGSVALLDRRLSRADVTQAPLPAALTEAACLHVNESGLVAVRASDAAVVLSVLPDTELPAVERRRSVSLRRWATRLAHAAGGADGATVAPVPTAVADRVAFAWLADGWCTQDKATGEVTGYDEDGQQRWATGVAAGVLAAGHGFVAVGTEGGQVTVLDAATGARVAAVEGTGPASWSASAMAVASTDRRDVLVCDLAFGRQTRVPVHDTAGDPHWSPDGTLLAATTANAIVLWAGDSRERLRRIDIGTGRGRAALVWSPDGTRVALSHQGTQVTVWHTTTWRADPQPIRLGLEAGATVAWSPDSRLLAVPAQAPIGAVDLWDVRQGRVVLTVPPPPDRRRPVATLHWAADGRFAVGYDDGTVLRWTFPLPPPARDGQAPLAELATLVTSTAVLGATVAVPLLADLLCLLLGRDAGPLAQFSRHPGVALLRGLRWPQAAVVGLAVLVAAGLPSDDEPRPPDDAGPDEIRAAVEQSLAGALRFSPYDPPATALLRSLDQIDDSVLVLATLLGPDAVAAAPDLLARVRSQSFGGWSLAPRQQRLLGLRSLLRADGSSQGHGIGDTRAGVARHGELPSLLPSQLALPRPVLGVKLSRDELLFRTRQGDLVVRAQPVVLILDDTPAAFGAVGVTLRIVANLLAGIAIRQHRRCALVPLGSTVATFLTDMADLVRLWADGGVAGPDLAAALATATTAAAQLSDTVGGLPRLVLLTQPHLRCPSRPGLHVIRVHYPGLPVDDPAPRTHVLRPDAGPDEFHAVIGEVLTDRS